MRALFEVALKRGWAALATKTLTLCKMVERRIWSSQSPLRQFSSIPEVIIRKLEKNSDILWDRYYDLKPQDLGEMVKIPKMGKTLHKYVHLFPKVELSAHIQPITRSMIKIDLTISPDFEFDVTVHESALLFWIVVEDGDGEKILHYEPFILRATHAKEDQDVTLCVPMQDPMPPQYFVKVISDRWLHSEAVLAVSFRHLILPQKYPPPTELLDLQPLPVSALGDPSLCALYHNFKHFNAIQTQTFNALFQSNENVLLCAPTGSGKTVCAELAIIRHVKYEIPGKCVYITPKEVGPLSFLCRCKQNINIIFFVYRKLSP
jgi:pre-mRNA-splicing helicase BRR2